jgi:hypothetical protein
MSGLIQARAWSHMTRGVVARPFAPMQSLQGQAGRLVDPPPPPRSPIEAGGYPEKECHHNRDFHNFPKVKYFTIGKVLHALELPLLHYLVVDQKPVSGLLESRV